MTVALLLKTFQFHLVRLKGVFGLALGVLFYGFFREKTNQKVVDV